MNGILAANWPVLLALAGGTLLGLLAGYLLGKWHADDRHQKQHDDLQAAADALDRRARPASRDIPASKTTHYARPVQIDQADDTIGPSVLLVDDRLEMLGIHAAYLRKHGYRVLLAENGIDGLAFARAYRPDLIVLDQSMPDLTGVEVARQLKADPATADMPILMMTALSYGAIGMVALEAGCEAFLPKPVEPSRLLREVEKRIRRH
jgi:CheY-like chemotaxis protein